MPHFKEIHLIYDPKFLEHDTEGGEHPEIPKRLSAIKKQLETGPLKEYIKIVPPRVATRDQVLKIHKDAYLMRFEEACLAGNLTLGHPDNRICYESFDIALLAAGAGITGIDEIESDPDKVIFCLIRPPGHHAEAALALGFCFFNNAAIAARYWQEKFNRKKIAIIDWDAHHGNGIQSAFEEDPSVFYISIHEHPTFSFPGTGYSAEKGLGAGIGYTLNIPLSPGAKDQDVLNAIEEKVEPALQSFEPDAIIIAAGFDGHIMDDMSGLSYSTKLYGHLGIKMDDFARRFCSGRIISILEGGYHIDALAASCEAYIAGLSIKT